METAGSADTTFEDAPADGDWKWTIAREAVTAFSGDTRRFKCLHCCFDGDVPGVLGFSRPPPGHGGGLRPPVSVANITVMVNVYRPTSELVSD